MQLFDKAGRPVTLLSVAELAKKVGFGSKMGIHHKLKSGKVSDIPGLLGTTRVANTVIMVMEDQQPPA